MSGHRPFSDLRPDVTVRQYVEQCLSGWRFILKMNRELGWPEQAMCVYQPSQFVAQLEQILQRMDTDETRAA